MTFVTRLRSHQLPSETARQLPDLSTIILVEPSSTDDSRLQGAPPTPDARVRSFLLLAQFAVVIAEAVLNGRARVALWKYVTARVVIEGVTMKVA